MGKIERYVDSNIIGWDMMVQIIDKIALVVREETYQNFCDLIPILKSDLNNKMIDRLLDKR